jgi:hypothetical protein
VIGVGIKAGFYPASNNLNSGFRGNPFPERERSGEGRYYIFLCDLCVLCVKKILGFDVTPPGIEIDVKRCCD